MKEQRLQYISSGLSPKQQYDNILSVLDHGIDWVQLRYKHGTTLACYQLAETVVKLKERYNFILIINDDPQLALQVNADGVHLGLTDPPIQQARALLGEGKIIGGTANTQADVLQRVKENCSYIGLGPLRFTETKKNLSPILGITGYKQILGSVPKDTPPIFAIGAVSQDDIAQLRALGVYGVAMSQQIEKHLDQQHYINTLNDLLHGQYA